MSATPYAEVAIPNVPLRQLFTYGVPKALMGRVVPGARVAVPFARRKVAGFVVGLRDTPPEGLKRISKIAGLLEDEPVFDEELLTFLDQAARYYMHPVGEVLRAAAPALPKGAFKRLRDTGFLEAGEALKGSAVKVRVETYARRSEAAPDGRLGASQKRILALLDERGEVSLTELRAHVKGARQVVRRLVDKGLLTTEDREVRADRFFGEPVERDTPPSLTPPQQLAVDALVGALDGPPDPKSGRGFLLHGVTGSGKTEVYLHLIAEAQRRGQGALLLVPEIGLTPQLVGRFRARFGDAIAVLHSGLKTTERDGFWRALRRGELRLAVGARSALFAPVRDLGVIVVDEEHDPSFKQEDGFRYHARDMALLRARAAGAVCVLGSATPSLETFHLAEQQRLRLLSLPTRATGQVMPDVEVVDLKRHKVGPTGHRFISGPLHHALVDCLANEGQAILFLNRRGYAPSQMCGACGETLQCPACSVTLTEHRRAGALRCHYCDFQMQVDQSCPACGQPALVAMGLGTEKLEDDLAELYAPARVARLDRDTATGAGIEEVLDKLRRREIDILVGTQMVTKGHDVESVTLVGVLLADQSLGFPDFRAGERTFQLLAQVAGRAGRGSRPGRVIFQTFQPEHHAIRAAAKHDYDAFYRGEMTERAELPYPPHNRLVAVRVDAGDERRARGAAEELARVARQHPLVPGSDLVVLGPASAPLARLRGRYRYRFLLRASDRRVLRAVAAAVAARVDTGLGPARATVDIDPVSMM